ncbi:2-methylcitrate dehydratase [Limnohabitans sp. 2KL-1]|jgi:2-methylcitrate dehydratase PrpD|uniref:MmgE/PrpD family protein n=1 Tax=Limnohabitans sp. 2KL-1 TaxID=1100699 RepID=UPI000D33C722|nr:MmgE/PrpD family protein [Limnohabitans sp. 2KL-1]PUE49370.1 2-methylcitrate dehydratase [Limnohabitans sp. 2KL-1]
MTINTAVAADHNAPPITAQLARFVAEHPAQGWSDAVEHEAHRTFLNWLGCAIGAARHEAVESALAAVHMLAPAPQATLAGRTERVDMASAALINGISSHTFDFDDTHLKTIIHPAGPVASAVMALAETQNSSGRQVMDALVLGIDVACRMGNLVYPEHYDRGWHITGSTGTLGAAAACARLLGLDAQQTTMALGIAASQPVGLREQFGTMTKPFHPGGAARAGLMSALMARHGFTASPRSLEAPRGWAQVVSTKYDWREAQDELGQRFEISFNAYKPFACGIVIHPSIDACAQLRAQGVKPEEVQSIELRVHPLVLELTGKKTPQDGLQGKFSVYHGCAVGLIFGRAGEEEFSDHIVRREDVVRLRDKVQAVVDTSVREESVYVTAHLVDGRSVKVHVEHAIGSLQKPMTDADLESKFHDLSDPILGTARVSDILETCWSLGKAPNLQGLLALLKP